MRLKAKLTPAVLQTFLQKRAAPAIVFITQLIAVVAFALLPVFAERWFKLPFLGVFIEHTLIINTGTTQLGSWNLPTVRQLDSSRLTALDGIPVTDVSQLNILLSQHQPGDRVMVTVQNQAGEKFNQAITLREFTYTDRAIYFILPYFIGLIYLGSSVWIFSLRRSDPSGRAFALFTAAVGLSVAGFFDSYTTSYLTPLWIASLYLAGGSLVNLTLLFPEQTLLVIRYPFVRWVSYVPSILLLAYTLPTLYDVDHPLAYVIPLQIGLIYACFAAILLIAWTAIRRFTSASPITREQARLVLLGSGISYVPLMVWFLLSFFWQGSRFSSVLLLPTVMFPMVAGYTILRYRLLNTDYLLSRTTLYTALSILAASGYALLVSGVSLLFGSALPSNHPLLIGLMVFVFAILLNPLRTWLQKSVDALFFRGQTVYQERMQRFGRELTQTTELPAIVNLLRGYVQEDMHPSQLHIFIRDALSGLYIAQPDVNGQSTTDIRFPTDSALVMILTQRRNSIFLGGSDTLPTLLQSERARLALLGVQLFVPLPGKSQLVGWISLGVKRSGAPFTNSDLRYMESLGDQAALAVERAQVVANLERRVREMDVLTRIAQGVNITLAFDDILELIYAQTNLLIPTRDLRVILRNDTTQTLYYAFYLENDERLRERENNPLLENQYLEEEVIRSRRALLTDDFERECRGRGILAHDPDIFAWMGVPLNAGAETIGTISLGSRDPSQIYSDQHLSLLQAIADQAASAIVKARLYQESERHSRQLATLNEVGKSLTSTLELRPLLNKILESAAEILNCEAGSLFMLDEHTQELIFEVTFGPVAAELVGQRLPPGTGMVGKAVDTGQSIIANDVRRTQDWSDKTDQQTGFITRDLMVVPMKVHEQTIGVIEVINKKDGSPFNQDDQGLLTTFASQAAIAVDNARLYTQTDQALSARVEELSVMQRIDRELNASLDLERALRITLDWAMRQSHVEAGLVGLLDVEVDGNLPSIRIIASQGYDSELGPPPEQEGTSIGIRRLQLEFACLQKAIEVGQPQTLSLVSPASNPIAPAGAQQPGDSTGQQVLLSGGKSQMVVPIRRTSDVIGVIMLESKQAEVSPKETIAFLSRLSDHAAIAITNAQLYTDLQAANIAKSDFISLVSHELKTPMTSIRGYADLLAQGVVGPINEVQSNFLNTIRANVGRMATLVSDLADVSRIEAGRMRLDFSAVKLAELIQEVAHSQQAQTTEKKLTLQLDIPTDLPPVWGDQNRITQIMANLLSNAIKYTPPEGKINIQAVRMTNQWDAKGPPEVVCISVHDTGFGITPKDQPMIFQKFFRSEEQKIRESTGTGLGLNITRHLVEMQGGHIWFESEAGNGTTFSFTIPIAATA